MKVFKLNKKIKRVMVGDRSIFEYDEIKRVEPNNTYHLYYKGGCIGILADEDTEVI